MAAAVSEQPPEVPQWLKTLPLAPEYYPTLAEFEDPISYILKIEKEASRYGICKIVPPVPPQPKKTAIANLNRSLSARNPNHDSKSAPTFTTRHQQIGFCPRKPRPVQKPVWQSGENYTLQQFEAKAKQFEKTQLKKSGKKGFSALEIETLFWKASVDKPFTVEYANDMPGSAFVAVNEKKRREAGDSPASLGETAWNMRAVSRAKGSLLRFMKEEIPGVTSPMVYIAMLFSWFAWHVEDHDLHSLNYMHMGAGKTWYGVPREAAAAFEEVVRVHGYGGEVNPLVTFATLGEKTTVMSPEVLIGAGIPCCRLVQNVGEFVVTFPGAYHSGFSHGFNCGEAANIATPEWLRFAKEAAIRRASINYPPMVSHFQLLYALARTLSPRASAKTVSEPRSSRLKDKKKGEGESMVKELFVQSMLQNNNLLSALLEQGSSCVLLPQNSSEISVCSNLHAGSKRKVKPRLSLGLSSDEEAPGTSTILLSDDIMLDKNVRLRHLSGFSSVNGKYLSTNGTDILPLLSLKYKQSAGDDSCVSTSMTWDMDDENKSTSQGSGLLDQRLFSCVTCGILSYACAAVVQPRKAASEYLMSADCSSFNDWNVRSGELTDGPVVANAKEDTSELDKNSEKNFRDDVYDVPVQSGCYNAKFSDQNVKAASDSGDRKAISSLDLLAFAYGNSSDSDEEPVEPEVPGCPQNDDLGDQPFSVSGNNFLRGDFISHSPEPEYQGATACSHTSSQENEFKRSWTSPNLKGGSRNTSNCSLDDGIETSKAMVSNYFNGSCRDPVVFLTTGSAEYQSDVKMEKLDCGLVDYSRPFRSLSNSSSANRLSEINRSTNIDVSVRNTNMLFLQRSDEDSTRKHLFCLEHAMEVEKQLRPIGGAHILLVCHSEYPKIEAEAKLLAEDLGISCLWQEVTFREATSEDGEMIRSALDDEEAIPGNLDWTVKLGINLYYSANLSRSPLYTKQMPYNSIIYKVFGCNSLPNSPVIPKVYTRGCGKQKKIVVAGKWCGKVWMSNQVHPYLVHRDTEEEEEELAINFLARVATSSAKLERNAEKCYETEHAITKEETSSPCIPMTASRKLGQKRIKTFAKAKTKRRKCPLQEDNSVGAGEDSSEHDSPRVCVESPQGGQIKRENPTLSCNGSRSSGRKRDSNTKEEVNSGGPSTRLRRRPPRPPKPAAAEEPKLKPSSEKQTSTSKKARKAIASGSEVKEAAEYQCDMDGCTMGFSTKQELLLHKRNICSVKGCGKKFFSHKYLVQHRRVHMDDRPLKCPWKGCKMTFKWAWARTEHIRVHTGARPYVCREPGCGQTFRFVSDFSRHKRKTGHSVKGKG